MRLPLGWYGRIEDPVRARAVAASTRLLDRTEMHALFPDATLWEERVLGLTKSLVVYGGW